MVRVGAEYGTNGSDGRGRVAGMAVGAVLDDPPLGVEVFCVGP